MATKKKKQLFQPLAGDAVRKHFGKVPAHDLLTSARTFPVTSRVDLQQAAEKLIAAYPGRLLGLHTQFLHVTMSFAHVLTPDQYPVVVGPLQYQEIDIGEVEPARCVANAIWLCHDGKLPFALLITPAVHFGQPAGTHIEIAVPPGDAGAKLSRALLGKLEKMVHESGSYRGKVISLEQTHDYSGMAGTVRVHKLRSVSRDEVILPEKTLKLLERNITGFIENRQRLKQLGMSAKKGLLFYGPPGTGKTHTLHYLASQLPGHTTLLVTSEQVGLLDVYFQLARFLQPAMIVIEDVDLIARARETMHGGCEELLLNKLLNEMDGLREDAELLFILTTNRPDQLETALAARPGRIDQAIEFPLPDADGRKKLVHLYSRGLVVPHDAVIGIAHKTEGASAAFIKELMRRVAQLLVSAGRGDSVRLEDVDSALEEMLFTGGALNAKLLGGAAITPGDNEASIATSN
jgi:AAA+ superfamily predicted ATPase